MAKSAPGRDFGDKPDLKYFKDRKISGVSRPSPEARAKIDIEVTPAMVEELHRQVDGIIGKIGILQDEIRRTAKERIPVIADAQEVRHALRILYPEWDENWIHIDQYIESLHYLYSRSKINSVDLTAAMMGNLEVDGRKLDRAQWMSSDGISDADLAIMFGQYLLCMVANRILQPYSAPNMQQIAATKIIYPGTEAVPASAQILIGLAALLLQVAENVDAVRGLIDDTVGSLEQFAGLNTDDIMAQAQAQGKDPLIDRYLQGQRPYHHDLIIRYVQDFLRENQEPGYEGWDVYSPLEDTKIDMVSARTEIARYGKTEEEGVNVSFNMSTDMYRLQSFRAHATNSWLDRLATLLSSKLASNLLCCLVMYLGALPTERLQMLRFGLAIAAGGLNIDVGVSFKNFGARVNSFLSEQVLEPILHLVDQHFHRFSAEVLAALDPDQWSDPELYDVVTTCYPINALFEYALNGVERLRAMLKNLIRRAWRRIRVKQLNGGWALRISADSMMAKVLLKLVDSLIQAVERGNLCAREGGRSPSPDEVENFVDRLSGGFGVPIEVPTEGDPFVVFTPTPFKTAQGLDVMIGSPGEEEREFRATDCFRENARPDVVLKALGMSLQMDRELRDGSPHKTRADQTLAERGGI